MTRSSRALGAWIVRLSASSAVLVAAGASGCILQGNKSTDFPPGLEPVADNTAPEPGDGDMPEDVSIVTGKGNRDDGDYVYVHMRGYVYAPAATVWTIMQDPDVVADRRHTTRHRVSYDVEPDYDLSYEIHYTEERLLTVEWDEDWRYGAVAGTFDEPEEGAVRFQKVYGSDFIDYIDGSLSLVAVTDDITEVGMVEELSALEEDPDVSERYAHDIYDNIVAVKNGDPLPMY